MCVAQFFNAYSGKDKAKQAEDEAADDTEEEEDSDSEDDLQQPGPAVATKDTAASDEAPTKQRKRARPADKATGTATNPRSMKMAAR
jgi:hypothetical protein